MARITVAVAFALLLTACGEMEDSAFVDEGDNLTPVAVLDAPLRVRAGEPVLLDARRSTDEDGFITEYWYETGDDAPLRQTVSAELYKTYDEPGTYSVTLHVIDDRGSKDTDRAEIEVR